MAKAAQTEVEQFSKYGQAVQKAMDALMAARIMGEGVWQAEENLAVVLGDTMALANMLGRRRVYLELDAVAGKNPPSNQVLAGANLIVPSVPFELAIEDMVSREPRLAQSAEAVVEVYQDHGFALARSSSAKVSAKVQSLMNGLMEQPSLYDAPTIEIQKLAASESQDWTRAYSETVYRTNMNTAYTSGRIEKAKDQDVAQVIGALQFITARDVDVRSNHAAAQGMIASQYDPIWETLRPPLGYNCRCAVRMVARSELRRLGLVEGSMILQPQGYNVAKNFRAAAPDKGFKGAA